MKHNNLYSSKSLYALTEIKGRFLSYYVHRKMYPQDEDKVVVVGHRWVNRPDLMALDLYGNEDYFMAIAIRNKLNDPVFDLTYGKELVIPPYGYVVEVFS